MIEENAVVSRVDGSRADVESVVKSSCHGCQQQDSCGSGQIAKAFPQRRMKVTVDHNIDDLKVGDEVVIAVAEQAMLRSAMVVYLWPLIGLLAGAALAQLYLVEHFAIAEPWALLIAVIGALVGGVLAKRQQQHHRNQNGLRPHIVRRCENITTKFQ